MSQSITIPASLDDAVDELNGIGELITARKWERAAIVAAYVRLDGSGRNARDFARLGIVGLTTPTSVTKYVQAWLDANAGRYPKPGATRRLPRKEFPAMRSGTDGYASTAGATATIDRLMVEHGDDVVARAVTERAPVAAARSVMGANEARHETQRIQRQESHIFDREPVDADHIDATQTVDYELNMALHNLHSAVTRTELALRPFSTMQLDAEVVARLRADYDALGMLISLAGGIPDDVSEVVR
jgi:hypothetical protein